jgi:hypothetical protein
MKHLYFWTAVIDIIYVVLCLVLMFSTCNENNAIIFYKRYSLAIMPLILCLMFQFVIFYNEVTDEDEMNMEK